MISIMKRNKTTIESREFLIFARKREQDFTRKRKLPFDKLILFMINLIRSSIKCCLDKFFETMGETEKHMAQQSFSEARQKIRWEAFEFLFNDTVEAIYEGGYEKWHGYRVHAIDGTKIQLPDDKNLRSHFGAVGRNSTAATAQASALYDVFNGVIVDTKIEPIATDERTLATMHIDKLCKTKSFDKELIIFDRGYASFALITYLIMCNIRFLMRVKTGFNNDIDNLPNGDHTIVLQREGEKDICVRVLKFPLKSGEIETLVTDITDKRMGTNAFKTLYFKRWPIETKYGEIKNKLEIENFSGRTVDAIKQDFYITMYMSNIVTVASWEAQPIIEQERENKDNRYDYQVNINHAIGVLKDRFIAAFLESDDELRSKKVNHILALLVKCATPIRPNRSVVRNNSTRKAKFRHNSKSNC